MHHLVMIIAKKYNVSTQDIVGKNRKGNLPEARKMSCYLLRKKYKESEIAVYLNLTREYVYSAAKDMEFYINTYPNLKQKAMSIENTIVLKEEAKKIEEWLQKNFEANPTVVFEKQQQLRNINHKINTLCPQI